MIRLPFLFGDRHQQTIGGSSLFLAVWLLLATVPAAKAGDGGLDPAILKKIKQATVFLQVRLPEGRVAQASGFFVDEPGLVVTNAHALGMLNSDGQPPDRVDVIVDSGEATTHTLQAIVLGVDRSSDLGLLRVEGKKFPEPLKLGTAKNLLETQAVYIFGFPLAKQLGKNITVSKSSVSSLRKSGAYLRQIQVNGGMHPGNSGGPVTDGKRQLVGVAVAGLPTTQINFAIPADYVTTLLNGRILSDAEGTPAQNGDKIKLPLRLEMIDPLGRIQKVVVESWTGEDGTPRPASLSEPKPLPGDENQQSVTFAYDKKTGIATGEIVLPALPRADQVYWYRAVITNGTGETRWVGAKIVRSKIPPAK